MQRAAFANIVLGAASLWVWWDVCAKFNLHIVAWRIISHVSFQSFFCYSIGNYCMWPSTLMTPQSHHPKVKDYIQEECGRAPVLNLERVALVLCDANNVLLKHPQEYPLTCLRMIGKFPDDEDSQKTIDWWRSNHSPISVGGVCVIWSSGLKLGAKIRREKHSWKISSLFDFDCLHDFPYRRCVLKAWQRGFKSTSSTSRAVFHKRSNIESMQYAWLH